MSDSKMPNSRRTFLKLAGVLAAGSAAGCQLETRNPEAQAVPGADRSTGFDRNVLDALAEIVLPSELGPKGRDAATGAFIVWADGYSPVAEEMHGYGYADIRFLPPDPSPTWRSQLEALDLLAKKPQQKSFAQLAPAARRAVLDVALKGHGGERLPAPLDATHIAIALLAHWASSPDAWDLAYGAKITPDSCRTLAEATPRPLPITGLRA